MPKGPDKSPRRPAAQRNTTADRAIDLLLLFDEEHPVLTATEISKHLGVARSTIYRYLFTLREYGFVEEADLGEGFRLGPRVFQLARIARQGIGLVELALPVMERLCAATGETVVLTRRAGSLVTCIERVESLHPIRLSYERGQVLPIHAGASAKVLLAFEPQSEVDRVLRGFRLKRFTEHTVTDRRQLRAELDDIRTQGYAVSIGEIDPGVCGVAAPILDASGRVVAAVSVAGPEFRIDERERPKVIDAVCEAAVAISSRIEELALELSRTSEAEA